MSRNPDTYTALAEPVKLSAGVPAGMDLALARSILVGLHAVRDMLNGEGLKRTIKGKMLGERDLARAIGRLNDEIIDLGKAVKAAGDSRPSKAQKGGL